MNASLSSLDDIILLRVFSYLSIKDLLNCALVCKKWNRLVDEELESNRKQKITTFLFRSEKWERDDKYSDALQIRLHDFSTEWTREKSNIRVLPGFAILALNTPLFHSLISQEWKPPIRGVDVEESSTLRSKRRKKESENTKLISSSIIDRLPNLLDIFKKQTELLFIFGYGFIGTNASRTETVEVESEFDSPAFAGIVFPKCDERFRFVVRKLSSEEVYKIKSSQDLNILFGLDKSTTECLRWMLVLAKTRKNLKPFLNEFKRLQSELDFACSGGIPYMFYQESKNRIPLNQICLVGLVGAKANISVAQIVIPDTKNESVDFDQVWSSKIDALKSSKVFETTTNSSRQTYEFGFQISCCGRGRYYHNETPNYESSLLRKAFPNLPVIGFFANGELGCDYLPGARFHFQSKKEPKLERFFHDQLKSLTFSSVFTLISIKD